MPTNFVLYFRDVLTTKANPLFDTVDELIAAKPAQVIVFNDTNILQTDIQEEEQNNVSNDAHFDPGVGDPIIEKQYNGTKGRNIILKIITDTDQSVMRQKLRTFIELPQIEPAYHEFGIFGIFHPVVSDFNVDPTNLFGYTIDRPLKGYRSGSEIVPITLRLSLGGNFKLAGP